MKAFMMSGLRHGKPTINMEYCDEGVANRSEGWSALSVTVVDVDESTGLSKFPIGDTVYL